MSQYYDLQYKKKTKRQKSSSSECIKSVVINVDIKFLTINKLFHCVLSHFILDRLYELEQVLK